MRTIDIDDIAVRWEEYGTGAPVIFIHGIPTSPALWRHVIPLVEGARALAWEMPGYGESWRQRGDISVKSQAGYLLSWMDRVGLERAVLVGHDLGGGVAQIAAARGPSRCAGLVLTNAISYDSWPIPSVIAMRATAPLVERMPTPIFKGVIGSFILRGHDDSAVGRRSLALHWPNYDHAEGPEAFVRQIKSLRTRDTMEIAPRLRELAVPAEIVWGAADRFQKIEYGRRLAGDLRAPLDVIESGKHFVPEDHPDRLAAAINRVLEHSPV